MKSPTSMAVDRGIQSEEDYEYERLRQDYADPDAAGPRRDAGTDIIEEDIDRIGFKGSKSLGIGQLVTNPSIKQGETIYREPIKLFQRQGNDIKRHTIERESLNMFQEMNAKPKTPLRNLGAAKRSHSHKCLKSSREASAERKRTQG